METNVEYKFSIIIPTRDRPQFITESLKYISLSKYKNIEVIISDNCSVEEKSCREAVENAPLKGVIYLRPTQQLSMIENWNYPLSHVTGDYVMYLTDKMMLLPHTLALANKAANEIHADIINWVDDIYTPQSYPNYFGKGYYYSNNNDCIPGKSDYYVFDGMDMLNTKTVAKERRTEQSRFTYVSGKIIFGVYKIELIEKIILKYNKLFHNLSPDYTSMILALNEATVCAILSKPGIVHLNTDLSNGGTADVDDAFALSFYETLKEKELALGNLLIPQLYCSTNNGITHDYLYFKKKYDLQYEIDKVKWLFYIYEDLYLKSRKWSSIFKEHEQKGYFIDYMKQLPSEDTNRLNHLIDNLLNANQAIQKDIEKKNDNSTKSNFLRKLIKFIIPYGIVSTYLNNLREKSSIPLGYTNSLQEAINSIYHHRT